MSAAGGGGGGGDAADADARAFRLCGINIGGLTVERLSFLFYPPSLFVVAVRDETSRDSECPGRTLQKNPRRGGRCRRVTAPACPLTDTGGLPWEQTSKRRLNPGRLRR